MQFDHSTDVLVVGSGGGALTTALTASLLGADALVVEKTELYGKCTSLRVWYDEGIEVEFGFVDESWAALPADEGTRGVVSNGMKVMFERKPLLSLLD